MTRFKLLSVPIVLAAVVLLVWLVRSRYASPPGVSFVQVKRETLVSSLSTNGKVEPLEWVTVRAEREGLVERVRVEKGGQVEKGAPLADLDARDARAELAAADARITQARAEIEVLASGGRAAELAEITGSLYRGRADLEKAQRDYQALERLVEKQAATRQEADEARHRAAQLEAEIKALESRRAALVSPADRTAAEARLRAAETAREQALRRSEQSTIRAAMSGVVYELSVRAGDYLRPGDLVAGIGRLEKVRVRVYVDEPELGRVAAGMPVLITWDALSGRQWKGAVEKTPTQIVALGARQVGEVICTIENPGRELLPGTNVNAEIQTQVVNNGLIIPREAVRREQDQAGVYVLDAGNRVRWRAVKLGVSSLTRAQVLEGLAEGDRVALASESPLRDGLRAAPALP
ncbi:MAG: efflux RND transporter periplasmic adaptor subunit [Acidobacteriota bacterium]